LHTEHKNLRAVVTLKNIFLSIKSLIGILITILGWVSYFRLLSSPYPASSDSLSDLIISILATLYFLQKAFKSIIVEQDLKDPLYFQSSVMKKDSRDTLTQKDFDNYQKKRKKRKY
jgi:hypothetical protein